MATNNFFKRVKDFFSSSEPTTALYHIIEIFQEKEEYWVKVQVDQKSAFF